MHEKNMRLLASVYGSSIILYRLNMKLPKFNHHMYSSFSQLVHEPVPYFEQTLRSKFSKITRQRFKMYIHFYRTGVALSEYNFSYNFCRVLIEKFGFKVRLRYGSPTVRKQVR